MDRVYFPHTMTKENIRIVKRMTNKNALEAHASNLYRANILNLKNFENFFHHRKGYQPNTFRKTMSIEIDIAYKHMSKISDSFNRVRKTQSET